MTAGRNRLGASGGTPRGGSRPPGSEDVFSALATGFFRRKIQESRFAPRLVVEQKVKILKDLTIGRDRDGKWRLVVGFQQQDIVFFNPAQAIPMDRFKSDFMRIDKYDREEQRPVVVPHAVCELKLGKGLVTHTLITYSTISSLLKSVFPHCAYYFLLYSNEERGLRPETVLRHTKGFDRVFLNWFKEKDEVWRAIEAHFNYLDKLGLLSGGSEIGQQAGAVGGSLTTGARTSGNPDPNEVWRRIEQNAGEKFRQLGGRPFTYKIRSRCVVPSTTARQIHRSQFDRALKLVPLENTVPVQHLQGPSYIYAILMDARIRGSDW